MTERLERVLRPRSVAVIGGGAWCEAVVAGIRRLRFAGQVYAVHPSRDSIAGVPCVARPEDLPEPPDAVFLGVNRSATIELVARLRALGAGGAVCFASGFSELGDEGAAYTARLLDAAGPMPVIGPNCYGILNALDGAALWPDIHGLVPVDRGVAILTQSSNIALNLTMQRRGLPIAYVATAGNQAQVGLAELGGALLADPRVTALGLHVEGFGDIPAFEALARQALALGKRVVVLKVGRSESARGATLSHTASLAGSDAGSDALLARLGMARVRTLAGLLEALKILHVAGPLAAPTLASMSCSGGEASLVADAAEVEGIRFPPLSDAQKIALRPVLGDMVHLANPLDYHTFIWGNGPAMEAAFALMLEGAAALTAIVVDFPRDDRCDAPSWQVLVDAACAAGARVGRPLALVSSLPDTMPEAMASDLISRGIIPLCGLEPALEAIRAAAMPAPAAIEPVWPAPRGDAPGAMLDEPSAKALLAASGVPVPEGAVAPDSAAAGRIAAGMGGRIVLKTIGAAHKSDSGGVRLGLAPDAVERAAQGMGPGPFLVERMVGDAVCELLVGVVADAAHGYVLTLGAGGTLTELMADTVSLLLPASRTEVAAALGRLRIAPMLTGYRGKPAVDMEAALDAIEAVQAAVAADLGQLLELEINPLILTPDRAVAADALIRRLAG